MTEKLPRFKVIDGSISGHCCFEATIVDTKEFEYGEPKNVCECFDKENAEAIILCLNFLFEELFPVVGIPNG